MLFEAIEKQTRHRYLLCSIEEEGEDERRSHEIFYEILRHARGVDMV